MGVDVGPIFGTDELDRIIKDSNGRLDRVEPGAAVTASQDGVGASVSVGNDTVDAAAEVRRNLRQRAWEWAARFRWRFRRG